MKRPLRFVLILAFVLTLGALVLVEMIARRSGVILSGHAYVAVAAGAFLTALVGGGLLALSFASARSGHDAAVRDFSPDGRSKAGQNKAGQNKAGQNKAGKSRFRRD